MKLINLRGSEVLPKKKNLSLSSMQVLDTYRNDTIEQMEQVCVEVDVEELVNIIHETQMFKEWAKNKEPLLRMAMKRLLAESLNESKQKWLKLERCES